LPFGMRDSCRKTSVTCSLVRSTPPGYQLPYAAIGATCTEGCVFKSKGCFVQTSLTAKMARAQDGAARGHSPLDVMREEATLINRAYRNGVPQDGGRDGQRGRDLRLHVGGDVGSAEGAELLAEAARGWRVRKGGVSWTYTHWWREVPRSAFGEINVLASVESPEEIEVAAAAGYPAAITVDAFPSRRAFELPGSSFRLIPCPAEVRGDAEERVTCVSCRLCLDRDLLALKVPRAIAFEAHGPQAAKVRDTLIQLRRSRSAAAPQSLRGPRREDAMKLREMKISGEGERREAAAQKEERHP